MPLATTGELRIRLRDLIGEPEPRPKTPTLDEQRDAVVRLLTKIAVRGQGSEKKFRGRKSI
jgi:hypothetical protein